jgi:hypothetical protein
MYRSWHKQQMAALPQDNKVGPDRRVQTQPYSPNADCWCRHKRTVLRFLPQKTAKLKPELAAIYWTSTQLHSYTAVTPITQLHCSYPNYTVTLQLHQLHSYPNYTVTLHTWHYDPSTTTILTRGQNISIFKNSNKLILGACRQLRAVDMKLHVLVWESLLLLGLQQPSTAFNSLCRLLDLVLRVV